MKKTVLTFALLVTMCNLALGITYAATCKGPGGSRLCGSTCVIQAGGSCVCEGSCTAEERAWVAGGGFAEVEEGNVY